MFWNSRLAWNGMSFTKLQIQLLQGVLGTRKHVASCVGAEMHETTHAQKINRMFNSGENCH
jgi:hypothetical protein